MQLGFANRYLMRIVTMRKQTLGWVFGAALLISTASVAQQTTTTQSSRLGSSPHGQVSAAFDKLPLTFEANQGQTGAQAKFVAHGKGYSAFLTAGGMILSLRPSKILQAQPMANAAPTASPNQPLKTTLQFNLLGAAQNPMVIGEDQRPGRANYFFGKDPKRWLTNVPTYGRVRYKNVYPGIDLVYYGNRQRLEYDFAVSAGGDPNRIQFEIKGADQIQLDSNGDLILKISGDEVRFQSPIVYQESRGQRVDVNGQYAITDSTHVGFRVAQFDSSKPLVIDPVLVYSTYLGGSGDESPTGIAIDSAGSIYVGGYTDSIDFPLATLGTLSPGDSHAFVAKLDATGSNLIYSDYLGGSSLDIAYALTLDGTNNVYISGTTASSDFPMVSPYQGTYPGASSAFLTKISPDGSSLLYSTYFGGNGYGVSVALAVDGSGNMIIAGYTTSTNLPVANAYQASVSANLGGVFGTYGFLTKFSPDGSSLAYSTYFGGSSNVEGVCQGSPCWFGPVSYIAGMAMDSSGSAYVAGNTDTSDFPVTSGAYLTTDTIPDGQVGFVGKFDSSGSLQYSTYFYDPSGSTIGIDAIAADESGSAYITGQGISDVSFPITSTSICDPAVYGEGCSTAFVTKFDPSGATLLYSTFLGPNNSAQPAALKIDSNKDVYVLASSYSPSFSLVNPLEPWTNPDDLLDWEALVVEIDPTATSQLWSTFLGGSSGSYGAGLALDSTGNLFVLGRTSATDFPITQTAFQNQYGGGQLDAFVLKIAADSAPSVAFGSATLEFASQTVGTTSDPQLALLRNMGSVALSISSISVTGDFAETDDCGTGVAAAGSCTFSVSFTPTNTGNRLGTIVIQDDAAGSPHVINLGGDGVGPAASLSSLSLSFAPVPVGSASVAQSVTLSNNGSIPLQISSIQVTGTFAQTNNCQPVVPASSSCIVNVSFMPPSAGTFSGALTISDNAPGSPQTLNLTGTVSDFSLASSAPNGSTKPGASATYLLTVTPLGGSFTSAVKLSCTGLPTQTTCSLSPSAVTPGGSIATATLTLETTGSLTGVGRGRLPENSRVNAIWVPLQAIGIFGIVFAGSRRRSKKRRTDVLMGLMFVALLFTTACAGGVGGAPKAQSGTPAGTYNITVTGSSGSLQHSVNLTLIVE
jgi:Beta-propeller repeat